MVLRVRVPYLVPGHFSSCRGDGFLASQREHFGMFLAYKTIWDVSRLQPSKDVKTFFWDTSKRVNLMGNLESSITFLSNPFFVD